jgi:hypothetical protein
VTKKKKKRDRRAEVKVTMTPERERELMQEFYETHSFDEELRFEDYPDPGDED